MQLVVTGRKVCNRVLATDYESITAVSTGQAVVTAETVYDVISTIAGQCVVKISIFDTRRSRTDI